MQFIKKNTISKTRVSIYLLLMIGMALLVSSCQNQSTPIAEVVESSTSSQLDSESDTEEQTRSNDEEASIEKSTLDVIFGYEGTVFTLVLEDNPTANKIAQEVGAVEWNLPIVNFDNFPDFEVLQFYDIPKQYEIPSNPEKVTQEKAGEVYYSHPNRIILFYQDADVEGEYTKIGSIEYSDTFYDSVVNNPVLQGWNTKIITVKPSK